MASPAAIVLLVILGALMVWGIIERKKVDKWIKRKWDEFFGDDSPAPAPAPVSAPTPAPAPAPAPTPTPSPSPAPAPAPAPSPTPSPPSTNDDGVQGANLNDNTGDDNTDDGIGTYMIEPYNIKK
jgi:hypothetical protein